MTELQELPPTITVERAAEVLGISRRSAYRAVTTGELPSLKLGRRLVVPTPRLLEMLGVGGAPTAAPPRVTGVEPLRPTA